MKIFRLFLLIMLILCHSIADAQAQGLITGNFNGYHFSTLVREIEKQTDWHIYYDSTETDSIEIYLTANQQTVQQLLDIVFKNMDFHYALGLSLIHISE